MFIPLTFIFSFAGFDGCLRGRQQRVFSPATCAVPFFLAPFSFVLVLWSGSLLSCFSLVTFAFGLVFSCHVLSLALFILALSLTSCSFFAPSLSPVLSCPDLSPLVLFAPFSLVLFCLALSLSSCSLSSCSLLPFFSPLVLFTPFSLVLLSCLVPSCPVLSWDFSCHDINCHGLSYPVLSCLALSCPVLFP